MWSRNWPNSSTATPSVSPPPQPRNNLSPNDRNYAPSPLGRQTATRLRPSLTHYSSTLSLSSSPNVSTISLPGTVKQQQNVGYRKAVLTPLPPGIQDSLDVLESLLGIQLRPVKSVNGTNEGNVKDNSVGEIVVIPELEYISYINFKGLSLEEFARERNDEQTIGVLRYNESCRGGLAEECSYWYLMIVKLDG